MTNEEKILEMLAAMQSDIKTLKQDDDIFIAAMAIVNECTLVTANVKHFERIDELRTVNWRDD